jgi:hypothetical protein
MTPGLAEKERRTMILGHILRGLRLALAGSRLLAAGSEHERRAGAKENSD